MHMLLENMSMIGLNSFLALIPLLCGRLMVKTRQKLLQLAFALLWFFFLPNTLYILTDLRYLPEQWHQVHAAGKVAVAFQYLLYELLGVGCFLFALSALEQLLLRTRWRKKHLVLTVCLIVVNFCIGFGIVLGRVQRLNSWDIFVNVPKVIQASFHIVSSLELMLLVVLFGVFANGFYFVWRKCWAISTTLASKSK